MDLPKLGEILCVCYFQGFIFFESVLTAPLEFGNFCPYKSVPDDDVVLALSSALGCA